MKHVPIKLGPLALLLAVISICLTTLALLNVSTAKADERLAEKFAETVQTRYALETEGQELLERLYAGEEDGWERRGDGTLWRSVEKDGVTLQIGLRGEGADGYTVVNWTQEKEWEQDPHIADLWDGN